MKNTLKLMLILAILLLLGGCKSQTYTIRFLDWDETLLLELQLQNGETIVAPANPTREGYVFSGWNKEFSIAVTDLILVAQYDIALWTVIFKGQDDSVLKEEVVVHGSSATPPIVLDTERYTFEGWDTEYSDVQGHLIVTAQFEMITFIVSFYDDKGTLLKEENVEYGSNATAPFVMPREDEEFSHWDIEFNNIQSNSNVYAIFQEKEYSIEFYDGTTQLSLGMTTYKRSENATLPVAAKSGYAFSGWFLSEISLYELTHITSDIKGNLKLYSRWVKTDQDQLTAPTNVGEFVQINKNPHSSGNGFVYQPQFPVGVPTTSVVAYNWHSSNTKVATISAYSSISIASPGYAIITGTLKTDANVVYYCVIQTSADGVVKTTLEEANAPNFVVSTFRMNETDTIQKTVQKGGFVIAPTAPEKPGYTFTGWVGENQETIYNITKDTTFIPTYTLGTQSYSGKTISVLGDSITTYNGYIPNGFTYFYPYPTANLLDVNQTWWMQFINHYGMKLLVNNAWSGSAVAGSATSAAQNMTRLQYLFIGEVKPDVILIFMGANDAPSPYITLSQFDQAYGKMIENIQSYSPQSEIVLCALPSLPLYSDTDQENYSAVIQGYADEYGFVFIDFRDAFSRLESSAYLVDSAHPNKAGMDKLAEIAIRDFGAFIK